MFYSIYLILYFFFSIIIIISRFERPQNSKGLMPSWNCSYLWCIVLYSWYCVSRLWWQKCFKFNLFSLSAVFAILDHSLVINRSNFEFWFKKFGANVVKRNYLTKRKQLVKHGTHTSFTVFFVNFVLQGSVFSTSSN